MEYLLPRVEDRFLLNTLLNKINSYHLFKEAHYMNLLDNEYHIKNLEEIEESDVPIIIAAEAGYMDIVIQLVEEGIDVHILNIALICAAKGRNIDIMEYLIERGADDFNESPS